MQALASLHFSFYIKCKTKPKGEETMKKETTITFRLSEAEKQKITLLAANAGITAS